MGLREGSVRMCSLLWQFGFIANENRCFGSSAEMELWRDYTWHLICVVSQVKAFVLCTLFCVP